MKKLNRDKVLEDWAQRIESPLFKLSTFHAAPLCECNPRYADPYIWSHRGLLARACGVEFQIDSIADCWLMYKDTPNGTGYTHINPKVVEDFIKENNLVKLLEEIDTLMESSNLKVISKIIRGYKNGLK